MKLSTYVFVDLDDTLFQTLGKCTSKDWLEPVGFLKDGTPLSFSNERQRAFLDAMRAIGTVIPTTARDLDALGRVKLEFSHAKIAAHGAVVIAPDGTMDARWAAKVQEWSEGTRPLLEGLLERTLREVESRDLDLRVRLVGEHGQTHYFLAKSKTGELSDLDALERQFLADGENAGLRVHRNGNNLALLPAWLGKEFAVGWVKEHHLPREALFLGVGDSLTDLPYMRSCDFLVIPARSQIVRERLDGPANG
ncbi:MAG: haloacid dehalogenase [Fibrobacteres bacterium]|jgi:hydroxymethylpyrimidine pyrophosphatase-like HAD family hydrolase|nr:haloacid dehalogenase [Fibrobacterota bacterium]